MYTTLINIHKQMTKVYHCPVIVLNMKYISTRIFLISYIYCFSPRSTIFQLYRGGRFIGGGNRGTRIKPSSGNHWQTLIILCCTEYVLPWARFELATLSTDRITYDHDGASTRIHFRLLSIVWYIYITEI